MISKKKLLESIRDLPENFSIEELPDRIIFLQKIETGIAQSSEGQSISTEEARNKLKKWLK